MELKTQGLEALHAGLPNRIPPQGREELNGLLGQPRHLHRHDRATTGGLLQAAERMANGTRSRQLINRQELHPLDVADHG
jgi:23S rRNA-/tRNA-specific pseudouridylate synthase